MTQTITAEELLMELEAMPFLERDRFFSMLGRCFFKDENLTHDQVFGELANAEFSSQEAAEYLEISIATLRRYVRKETLKPSRIVGRNQMFAAQDLKKFKRSRH